MKKVEWAKYTFEFISIFVAVIAAFALNNWNEDRRDRQAEISILGEMNNGLQKDIEDIRVNISGHEDGIEACNYWIQLAMGKEGIDQDSLLYYYSNMTRDFISIQNNAGYESLKSRGLDLIKDDSLRFKIISMYEYHFSVLTKLEEQYDELQFHDSYFHKINDIIAPKLRITQNGQPSFPLPLQISQAERNILLLTISKIKSNRYFILGYYNNMEEEINILVDQINKEIQ